jgi:hypothetical protein
MKKKKLLILLLLLSANLFSQIKARLLPKKGLFVTTNQRNRITGSEFNIFTAGKKNHHSYFTWWEQDAGSSQNGKDIIFIGCKHTAIDGTYSLEQRGAVSSVAINCNYPYPEPGLAEMVHARIWMPFLKESHFEVRGNKLDFEQISSFSDSTFDLITPFGDFNFSSSHSFHIKRNDAPVTGKTDYTKEINTWYFMKKISRSTVPFRCPENFLSFKSEMRIASLQIYKPALLFRSKLPMRGYPRLQTSDFTKTSRGILGRECVLYT